MKTLFATTFGVILFTLSLNAQGMGGYGPPRPSGDGMGGLKKKTPARTTIITGSVTGATDTITVINETNDQSVVRISRGDASDLLMPNAGTELTNPMTIEGCVMGKIFEPPSWAMDTKAVGAVALTLDFLKGSPTTTEVGKRLEKIRKLIHGQIGQSRMLEELNGWWRFVKMNGLYRPEPICEDPVRIVLPQDIAERGSVVVKINGNHKGGYKSTIEDR